MAVAFHPIGNCVSISDLYQIVSYFLLYCNKVKIFCRIHRAATSLLCNIDAQLHQLPHMIKQIMSGLACKKNPVSEQSCQKEGKKLMDSVLFKSTGTVLFLPHPKRRNARPGSGFLLPLPQRISGDCRSQRLRQIHDFVPDRWLAHPGQRRHHVLWGKWSSARHRLHAAARSFI